MAEGDRRPGQGRDRRWAVWLSAQISAVALLFPQLFPSVFPDGLLPYYTVTIPLGIVAGILGYFSGRWWPVILAVVAGLSPLLLIWVVMLVLKIGYVLTGGHWPGPEWL